MELLFQIISLATGILQQQAAGTVVAKDAAIGEQLAKIAQAARAAYTEHMGQPLDAAYTEHMGQPLDAGMIQPEAEI